jgi:hypothetical protein
MQKQINCLHAVLKNRLMTQWKWTIEGVKFELEDRGNSLGDRGAGNESSDFFDLDGHCRADRDREWT